MKIAIIGSREGFCKEQVENIMKLLITRYTDGIELFCYITEWISGGARGIDTYAKNFNDKQFYPKKFTVIKPINPANKLDYLFRNVEIITMADKIIAFWDGKSRGTKFVIDYAKARNKDIEVIKNEDIANEQTNREIS